MNKRRCSECLVAPEREPAAVLVLRLRGFSLRMEGSLRQHEMSLANRNDDQNQDQNPNRDDKQVMIVDVSRRKFSLRLS